MDKFETIINGLNEYNKTPKSLRRFVDYARTLFNIFGLPEHFTWKNIKVINETGTVNIRENDGTTYIFKCKPTKLKRIYDTLLKIGVDIDSFDNLKDSIKDLDKFIGKYETAWGTKCALYHFSGESAGFFLNDYVNTTTLQSEDICWELQENV